MKLFTNMLPIIKSKTVVMQIRFSLVLPVLWLIQICLIFVGSSGCHDTETANSTPPTSAKQIRKLIKRLSSSQSKEIQNTIQDLRKIGDPVIPALIQALSSNNVQLRAHAAKALPVIGIGAHEAIPVLIQALGDPHAEVRQQAAFSLGLIGALTTVQPSGAIYPSAEETVIALIATLQDEDLNVRSNAASALGMLGEVAESAVPALIRVLNAPEARFRADAVAALGLIGTPVKLVISTLTQALDDQNQDVRQCARFHLERIGTFEALQPSKRINNSKRIFPPKR